LVHHNFEEVFGEGMKELPNTSRCAFVIIKIKANDEDNFFMRRDPSWQDINFIGGHDQPQDRGDFKRTAKRELLEEVSALRLFKSFKLELLTSEVPYGPIYSLSARRQMQYVLSFFLLQFTEDPSSFFKGFQGKTQNILVSSRNIREHFYQMSGLVQVLEHSLSGGLEAIPYSWPVDLWDAVSESALVEKNQLDLIIN
jgi:hypothetical protein